MDESPQQVKAIASPTMIRDLASGFTRKNSGMSPLLNETQMSSHSPMGSDTRSNLQSKQQLRMQRTTSPDIAGKKRAEANTS